MIDVSQRAVDDGVVAVRVVQSDRKSVVVMHIVVSMEIEHFPGFAVDKLIGEVVKAQSRSRAVKSKEVNARIIHRDQFPRRSVVISIAFDDGACAVDLDDCGEEALFRGVVIDPVYACRKVADAHIAVIAVVESDAAHQVDFGDDSLLGRTHRNEYRAVLIYAQSGVGVVIGREYAERRKERLAVFGKVGVFRGDVALQSRALRHYVDQRGQIRVRHIAYPIEYFADALFFFEVELRIVGVDQRRAERDGLAQARGVVFVGVNAVVRQFKYHCADIEIDVGQRFAVYRGDQIDDRAFDSRARRSERADIDASEIGRTQCHIQYFGDDDGSAVHKGGICHQSLVCGLHDLSDRVEVLGCVVEADVFVKIIKIGQLAEEDRFCRIHCKSHYVRKRLSVAVGDVVERGDDRLRDIQRFVRTEQLEYLVAEARLVAVGSEVVVESVRQAVFVKHLARFVIAQILVDK